MTELSISAPQRRVAEVVSAGAGHCGLSSAGHHYATSYHPYDAAAASTVPAAEVCEPAAVDIDGEEPEVDIVINNVVCSFNTRCHLNLKRVAMEGMNVIYKRDQGVSFLLSSTVGYAIIEWWSNSSL